MRETLLLVNESKHTAPRGPFALLKNKILGGRYTLAIIFIRDTRSRELNRRYRKKDSPTNVLSFAISKTEGELYLNLDAVKRETSQFDRAFNNLCLFLLIHGMFHLKGYVHSSKMERQEQAVRARFRV